MHEEDKHSIQRKGHPFGDRSKDLWKTLALWFHAAKNGSKEYNEATLLLTTNCKVPDCVARRIAKAETEKEIADCLQELKAIAVSSSETIKKYTDIFLSTEDEIIFNTIRRIKLNDSTSYPTDAGIKDSIISNLHVADHYNEDEVLESIVGWLHCVVKAKWTSNEDGWVTRKSLDLRLDQFLRQMQAQQIRARAAALISVTPEDSKEARTKRFIDHLVKIAVERDLFEEAIEDYCKFTVEYIRLIEEGYVTDDDWNAREGILKERWKGIHRRNSRNINDAIPEIVGVNTYEQTIDHREPLGGHVQEEYYLTRGHYHRLANRDEVWWYPCDRLDY